MSARRAPTTIDACLAKVPPAPRAALERLRRTIRAAAPRAVECVTYGVPAFRLDGRALVGFGAAARHCALYPMSTAVMEAFAADLRPYDCSKGTIRFGVDAPLPATLVRRIVKARVGEHAAKASAR